MQTILRATTLTAQTVSFSVTLNQAHSALDFVSDHYIVYEKIIFSIGGSDGRNIHCNKYCYYSRHEGIIRLNDTASECIRRCAFCKKKIFDALFHLHTTHNISWTRLSLATRWTPLLTLCAAHNVVVYLIDVLSRGMSVSKRAWASNFFQ